MEQVADGSTRAGLTMRHKRLTPSPSQAVVRILVAEAEGSVPREAGAVMWVWADGYDGTIGGGTLEHQAILYARALLTQEPPEWRRELRAYPLGPALGQCCGGMVRLLFEVCGASCVGASGARPRAAGVMQEGERCSPLRHGQPAVGLVVRPIVTGMPPILVTDRHHSGDLPLPVLRAIRAMLSGARPRATLLIRDHIIEPIAQPPHPLYLYGAGHVGRAVVRALAGLPFAVAWVDVADNRFPAEMPPNAEVVVATDPAAIAAAAPENALHLIMTFSHALDLSLCNAILGREFAWAGLIGSATKRARFEKRLREAGIADAALARLSCPIGIGGITGKEPAMIAISVAAQLAAWTSADRTVSTESDRHHG